MDRLIEKVKVLDSQEIPSAFERTLRAHSSEGKIDMETLKVLLAAHREEMGGKP